MTRGQDLPRAGQPEEPAIDVAAGVERVMGDHGMFGRVLAAFGSRYRGAGAAIREAVANGDTALAQRLAHTLKGAAGMIEARPLQRQAFALEQALRGGDGGWSGELILLEAELDRVLRELNR